MASCVQISRAIGAFYHVWKWHNVQQARSEMRRCTTHAVYRSKLCNRTIASTLKMQIWITTNNRGDENKVSGYGYGLWCGFKWGPHHATSHLESQHQSLPGCAEECGDPLVQSGGWWQTLCVAAELGAGPQVQRDPGLASEGVLRLCTLLSLAPSSSTWTCWTISFGHTSRTSPTWPPTTPKLTWSPALVEKACSQFQICIEAVIEAEGGYIE